METVGVLSRSTYYKSSIYVKEISGLLGLDQQGAQCMAPWDNLPVLGLCSVISLG